jgi:hypothetical protein
MIKDRWPPMESVSPARRRRSDVLIVVAVGAALAVAAVLALVVVGSTDDRTYTITTPAQAGGLTRLGAASTVRPSTVGYENIQQVVNGRARTPVTALYQEPSRRLLLTLQATTGDLGDPAGLLNRLRAHPPQVGQSKVEEINSSWKRLAATDPGPHGGRAVCGELSVSAPRSVPAESTITVCAWQTHHTFGYLFAPASPLSVADLAEVMRQMRPDLEKPA